MVTTDQLEMISTDPRVMHGQAVIAGTRVPVSVILDCLAAGMTAEEITAEYPTVSVAGVRAAAAYGAALARGTASAAAVAVKFKLDENPPVSSAAILISAGHDVDTVIDEGLPTRPIRTSSPQPPQLGGSWSHWIAGSATSVPTRPAAMPASSFCA
jgi:uncharacterized protein (DUF433 family)